MENQINDPYGYLNKADFTSELYKIEIKNLHARVGFSQLKQRLKSIGLNPHKIKIMKDYSFVTFKCAEDRDEALKKVSGHSWKGNVLTAKIAKGRASPYVQSRISQLNEDEPNDCKRIKLDNEPELTEEEKLKDHVSKYWRKSYDDQLIAKENKIKEILQNLYTKINKENPLVKASKNYFSKIEEVNIICPLLPIIRSPVETNYRNKCEFTIGMNLDGKGPIAGFCHGKYRDGIDAVGDPLCVPFVPQSMARVLERINELLARLVSPEFVPTLSAFSPSTDDGHLRSVTLRTGGSSDPSSIDGDSINHPQSMMVIIDIHPQSLTEVEIQRVSDYMSEYFLSSSGVNSEENEQCRVSSLLLAVRKNSGDPLDWSTTRLVFGDAHVTERLMGLQFRVSFNAFFQVNNRATEMLYRTIQNILTERVLNGDDGRKKRVTLLDVCCGTGTIGLAMAHLVDNVVGVEMCAESIKDAEHNATLNGISNVRFVVGKAEDLLSNLLFNEEKAQKDDVGEPVDREFVAIADPPRAGLHSNVIQALRKCDLVKKIIFVSCNPEAATKNFIEFARPISKRTHGCPFIPEVSVPVDLFPQTPHVELVMLLSRLSAA